MLPSLIIALSRELPTLREILSGCLPFLPLGTVQLYESSSRDFGCSVDLCGAVSAAGLPSGRRLCIQTPTTRGGRYAGAGAQESARAAIEAINPHASIIFMEDSIGPEVLERSGYVQAHRVPVAIGGPAAGSRAPGCGPAAAAHGALSLASGLLPRANGVSWVRRGAQDEPNCDVLPASIVLDSPLSARTSEQREPLQSLARGDGAPATVAVSGAAALAAGLRPGRDWGVDGAGAPPHLSRLREAVPFASSAAAPSAPLPATTPATRHGRGVGAQPRTQGRVNNPARGSVNTPAPTGGGGGLTTAAPPAPVAASAASAAPTAPSAAPAPSAARTRANGGTNADAAGAGGATPPSCARRRFVSRWRWCSEAEARWWWQPYYRGLCPSCLAGYTNGFRR